MALTFVTFNPTSFKENEIQLNLDKIIRINEVLDWLSLKHGTYCSEFPLYTAPHHFPYLISRFCRFSSIHECLLNLVNFFLFSDNFEFY